jgi:hypothetical protein
MIVTIVIATTEIAIGIAITITAATLTATLHRTMCGLAAGMTAMATSIPAEVAGILTNMGSGIDCTTATTGEKTATGTRLISSRRDRDLKIRPSFPYE